jgi:hypothetical protein
MSHSHTSSIDDGNDSESQLYIFYKDELEDVLDEAALHKMLKMREKERTAIKSQQKVEQYNNFIGSQTKLFVTIRELTYGITNVIPLPQSELNKIIENELDDAIKKAGEALQEMAIKLAKSPYDSSSQKDWDLLQKMTDNIIAFRKNPAEPAHTNNLLLTSQQMNKKSGLIWAQLKRTLLGVVGIACIVIGTLGVAPSFGISVALIALGAVLCVTAGITSVKSLVQTKIIHPLPADEINEILAKGKQLVTKEIGNPVDKHAGNVCSKTVYPAR